MTLALPRFVIAKTLATGQQAFYWNPPPYWRKQAESLGRKFPFESQPLGSGHSQADLDAAALPHNARFDEWREAGGTFGTGKAPGVRRYASAGSVAWLLETYLAHEIFSRRVSERSRPDYRRLFDLVISCPTKTGGTFGELAISSVTPAAAEKIYSWVLNETVDEEATAAARAIRPNASPVMTGKYRTGEKAVMYLKTAWRLMQPHHPGEFRKDVPNPWDSVQLKSYTRSQKPAHGRDDVYAFAWKAIELQQPELGAAAVICFEWLQRPENVVAGYIRWPDYVPGKSMRVEHHKTGKMVLHPLVDADDGSLFYEDAEAVLAELPRRGVPMVLRPDGTIYDQTRFAQLVRVVADAAGLPKSFTIDSCRHGGMTELEEAELTDGQGRALSAHKSKAYEGYAKRTEKRMLAATRRRIAYRQTGT
jgi:hypothetical protein